MSRALANPDLISLAAGFVDQQTLPAEETGKALSDLFRDTDAARAALQYGTTPGYPPLRELLLERALAADHASSDIPCPTLDQVVVTAGSNQLLHLVVESLLDPGDIVLCAAPTYLVFLGTLANVGAQSFGVATDEFGLIPEAFVETLRKLDAAGDLARVKAIYLVPYFDNPCGVTMPLERLAQLVEIAKAWSTENRIHVIADEAYRELRYSGDGVPSARTLDTEGDTVIVAGTFSKSYSPGIRLGWGILPEDLVGPVCSQKGNFDFGSPNFSQHLMHRVMREGLFDSHMERIRAGYRPKLQAMLDALDEHLAPLGGVRWFAPRGGLYVWLQLPDGMDSGLNGRLFDLAIREGVLYVPGQDCFPREGEPIRRNTMRLSFGVQPCERIREGIQALSRAIRAV
ncbi:MAG: PLP-dependent aminotransferase family protein [Pirellulaceae bacterium]